MKSSLLLPTAFAVILSLFCAADTSPDSSTLPAITKSCSEDYSICKATNIEATTIRYYLAIMRAKHPEIVAKPLIELTASYIESKQKALVQYSNAWCQFIQSTNRLSSIIIEKKTLIASNNFYKLTEELKKATLSVKAGFVYYSGTWKTLTEAIEIKAKERYYKTFTLDAKSLPLGFVGHEFLEVYNELMSNESTTQTHIYMFVIIPDRYDVGLGMYVKQINVNEIIIKRLLLKESEYLAQNMFGAKANVTERFYEDYVLYAHNLVDYLKEINSGLFSGFGFPIMDKLAKALSNNARILIICNVSSCNKDSKYIKPTFNQPYETFISEKYINANILALWLFNSANGEIIAKKALGCLD